jgi:peptidoglycan/xylan/chitin deacetylase (PgdA/CDA1 family)
MIVPEDLPGLTDALNAQFNEPIVQLRGFKHDIPNHLANATLIIGSGRVVPESMVLQKPVVAFGESNYEGIVSAENFEKAAVTNFGDTGASLTPEAHRVAADIVSVLENPPSENQLAHLASLTKGRYDATSVAREIAGVYERAVARTRSPRSIPVLMYHRVADKPILNSSHGIWVTAEQFAYQLDSLRGRGFETITFCDYFRFMKGEAPLPRRPIILTFDDGYEDNYTIALPLLQKYDCRAVIFAVSDTHRRTNFWDTGEPESALLTPQQILELHRSGNEIGSHTITHPRLPQLPAEEIRRELRESKHSLEQILGTEIISFAYPYGALDPTIKPLVEEAGYRFAVAADTGPFAFYDDFFEIRRTQVFPWTSKIGFWKKSLPLYYRYKAIKG